MKLTKGHADRHSRRRPFSSWMKRLANLKNSATTSTSPQPSAEKKHHIATGSKAKKHWNGKNNPYPESGHLHKPPAPSVTSGGRTSSFSPGSERVGSFTSYEDSMSANNVPLRSNKSTAPTLATNAETIHSDAGQSKAGTSNTNGGYYEGRNSTFSSPQHSQESLTTTLTTIQSTAPSGMLTNPAPNPTTQSPVHFSHQFPISPPASAVPSHLQPGPQSYVAATANGMLSDDASILTLASSSKRRRRHSVDTDASVRALAPSSLFGNSRESLPLSVLSSTIDINPQGALSSSQNRPGLASAERASVYSASGVGAPALISERNSYYSAKQGVDGASVRSGFLGHGRTESINGSITGLVANSSRDNEMVGRSSRRTSEWKDSDEKSVKGSVGEGPADAEMAETLEKDEHEDEHEKEKEN
jgi:hypothetical protein